MDTLEYVTTNLARTMMLKTSTQTISTSPIQTGVRLTITYSIPDKPISANNLHLGVGYKFNKRAVSKQRLVHHIPWDQLDTLELADHQLKNLLELTCHIYTNDEYTQYYDPSLLSDIEPAKYIPPPKPVVDPDVPRYSSKSVIANRILQQIEDDAAWDPTSLIAEIRGNKHA